MTRLHTLLQLQALVREHGRWWLVPFLGVLGLTACLLVVIHLIEYAAPFVYTIF